MKLYNYLKKQGYKIRVYAKPPIKGFHYHLKRDKDSLWFRDVKEIQEYLKLQNA